MKKTILINTLLLIIYSQQTLGNPHGEKEKFFSTTLGGGVAAAQNIRKDNLVKIWGKSYKNKSLIILPFPMATLKIWRFKTSYEGLTFSTIQRSWWGLNLLLSYSGAKYKADLMHSRKKSLFAGASARLMMFDLFYKRDVESKSSGSIFNIVYKHRFPVNKTFHFNAKLGVQFLSRNYVDYYFGVKGHEVIPGDRPLYFGKSSRIVSFKPGLMYMFTKSFFLMSGLGIDFFTSGIYDSPTVTRKTSLSAMTMLIVKI